MNMKTIPRYLQPKISGGSCAHGLTVARCGLTRYVVLLEALGVGYFSQITVLCTRCVLGSQHTGAPNKGSPAQSLVTEAHPAILHHLLVAYIGIGTTSKWQKKSNFKNRETVLNQYKNNSRHLQQKRSKSI